MKDKPKYRLYVDEVGNPDMESSDNPNHRFLSLTGVAMDLDHVRDVVHPEMERLKQAFFGQHPDEPLILHRKEIVNAKPPFDRLNDPAVRAAFDEALLDAFRRWEFTAFTVCGVMNHSSRSIGLPTLPSSRSNSISATRRELPSRSPASTVSEE